MKKGIIIIIQSEKFFYAVHNCSASEETVLHALLHNKITWLSRTIGSKNYI